MQVFTMGTFKTKTQLKPALFYGHPIYEVVNMQQHSYRCRRVNYMLDYGRGWRAAAFKNARSFVSCKGIRDCIQGYRIEDYKYFRLPWENAGTRETDFRYGVAEVQTNLANRFEVSATERPSKAQ